MYLQNAKVARYLSCISQKPSLHLRPFAVELTKQKMMTSTFVAYKNKLKFLSPLLCLLKTESQETGYFHFFLLHMARDEC